MRSVLSLASLIIFTLVRSASAQSSPQLLDLSPGTASSSPAKMVVMGGVAYFTATDPAHGLELWRSDGTPSGTYLVADINPGPTGSYIDYLTVAGDRLFFSASNGASGGELFKSDGTAAGTQLVIDLIAGPSSAIPRNITAFGSGIVLSYCTYATGCELFKSDGTAAGTVMLKDIRVGTQSSFPNYLTVLGNLVLFAANDAVIGEELWKTDGTVAGTVFVKNIDTAALVGEYDSTGRSYPTSLTAMGSNVYFMAKNAAQGRELWKSNGTTAGTVIVRDIVAGPTDSLPYDGLLRIENQLFFQCRIGTTYPDTNARTCHSDGTFAGTIAPTWWSGLLERAKLGGFFYFMGTYQEPWKGDLTLAGSAMLLDIAAGTEPHAGDRVHHGAKPRVLLRHRSRAGD